MVLRSLPSGQQFACLVARGFDDGVMVEDRKQPVEGLLRVGAFGVDELRESGLTSRDSENEDFIFRQIAFGLLAKVCNGGIPEAPIFASGGQKVPLSKFPRPVFFWRFFFFFSGSRVVPFWVGGAGFPPPLS